MSNFALAFHGDMRSALSANRMSQHYVPGISLNMDISLECPKFELIL